MPEPDEFTRKQSEHAIRLYTAYRHELDHNEIGGRFMPYRWWTLPDPLGGIWMAYSSMLSDYASELSVLTADCGVLTRLAATSRYPDAPGEPSEADARQAVEIAQRVRDAVLQHVPK